MKCPVDDTVLQMTDRQGIEIDYCPQCRGVWLDRGELDKLIERSATANAGAPVPPPQPRPEYGQPSSPPRGYDDRREGRSDSEYHRKKKRKDFLSDIFDF
jgi:Zn-finger nucleic acid-binding protein